jgi:hypothetical protein
VKYPWEPLGDSSGTFLDETLLLLSHAFMIRLLSRQEPGRAKLLGSLHGLFSQPNLD